MAKLSPISGGLSGIHNLNKALADLSDSFAKLSSGRRITRASDDAAALAIASQLESSLGTLDQASRNVRDAGSALAIADGSLSQIQDLSGRMQELAVQSANGTYSDEQRAALKNEYDSLSQEIGRIASTTEFNGTKLLDGSQITAQVGNGSGPSSQLAIGGADVSGLVAQAAAQNIGTQAGAQQAIGAIQQFSQNIGNLRSSFIGASQSRLDTIEQNISSQRIGQAESLSRVVDLDYASQTSYHAGREIMAQASLAVLAQGNRLNAGILSRLLG